MKNSLLKIVILTIVTVSFPVRAFSMSGNVEVIDTPTANSVGFGSYDLSFRLYDRGSVMSRLMYGIIMEGLTLGLSFDAENVVGAGEIKMHRPYMYIKLPLYSGNDIWPAISVGFDEQGRGRYDSGSEVYQFSPMGFFLVLTKTGLAPGFSLGAGINADYSVADTEEESVKGFANASFLLGPEFMLLAETRDIYEWKSYVNAGARYMLTPELYFDFSFLNIGGRGDIERILRITYSSKF